MKGYVRVNTMNTAVKWGFYVRVLSYVVGLLSVYCNGKLYLRDPRVYSGPWFAQTHIINLYDSPLVQFKLYADISRHQFVVLNTQREK